MDPNAPLCSAQLQHITCIATKNNEYSMGSSRSGTAAAPCVHTRGAFSAVTMRWYSPGLARRMVFCSIAVPLMAAAWV
jgi:hypothetical protein